MIRFHSYVGLEELNRRPWGKAVRPVSETLRVDSGHTGRGPGQQARPAPWVGRPHQTHACILCLCKTPSLFQTSFTVTGQSPKPLVNKSLNIKMLLCCSLQGVLHPKQKSLKSLEKAKSQRLQAGKQPCTYVCCYRSWS